MTSATQPHGSFQQPPPSEQQQQQQQRPRRSGNGRCCAMLLYALALFAVCWLQIAANVIAYFWTHPPNDPHGRFPLRSFRRESPSVSSGKREGNSGGNGGSGGGSEHFSDAGVDSSPPVTEASLEAELRELKTRLERVTERLEREIEDEEQSDPSRYWFGGTGTGTAPANGGTGKAKVFVPFTIRDVQRTVPVQIPHGFHVFDFIDLYAQDWDQNQTVGSYSTSNASLFHNGYLVPPRKNNNATKEEECRGYSKKCYRTKFLRVVDYLLSLERHSDTNTNTVEYYYFYMESDNDLCVPLTKIRELAYQYQRYFVSTGIGASGWIVTSRFLRDLVGFWRTHQQPRHETDWDELTAEQWLEPDSVAALLLKQNRNWSVTRRYLTSHSILVGTTKDAGSIAMLYEPDPEAAPTEPPSNKEPMDKRIKNGESSDSGVVMRPARYLPRCMEPHRGIWPNKTSTENGNHSENDSDNDNDNVDMHHWDFFDYSRCPESDIFPCHEEDLEELAKMDPYYLRRREQKLVGGMPKPEFEFECEWPNSKLPQERRVAPLNSGLDTAVGDYKCLVCLAQSACHPETEPSSAVDVDAFATYRLDVRQTVANKMVWLRVHEM
eukprot:jgi/Psemu1/44827/gm1.44827_g